MDQISSILKEIDSIIKAKEVGFGISNKLVTRTKALIARIAGNDSVYFEEFDKLIEANKKSFIYAPTDDLLTIGYQLSALSDDIKKGYFQEVSELIHANIFSDYIEMAEYFLDEGHKDPAAVIAGSTLESHLRKLCTNNNISTQQINSKGKAKPKSASLMNSELTKNKVFNKIQEKQVTAWLGIRNSSAHGHFGDYDENQVKSLIQGIIDFIIKHPA